jgi:hypothetical protein
LDKKRPLRVTGGARQEDKLGQPSSDQQDETGEAFERVHARFLRLFPDLVAELGGESGPLMARAGIDSESLFAGKTEATYRQMVRLLELAATECNCPDFGMRLAKRQGGGGMFGPLGLVMKNSKTFGDALHYVSEHTYAHSLAARIWLLRSAGDKTLFAGHDILLDRMPNKSQAMEQILLAGHLAAMDITGGRARVRRVHFRHQPVSSLRVYRRYFGCEIRFGQNEDGVVFSERDLASPIAGPGFASLRDRHFIHRVSVHAAQPTARGSSTRCDHAIRRHGSLSKRAHRRRA